MSLVAMTVHAGFSVPRRWIVVAAATLGMLAGFALATTVSVLIKPFESEFGWLRADISFAYTLLSAGAALGGLVVGWAFDRIDTRISRGARRSRDGGRTRGAVVEPRSRHRTTRIVSGQAPDGCFLTPVLDGPFQETSAAQ